MGLVGQPAHGDVADPTRADSGSSFLCVASAVLIVQAAKPAQSYHLSGTFSLIITVVLWQLARPQSSFLSRLGRRVAGTLEEATGLGWLQSV